MIDFCDERQLTIFAAMTPEKRVAIGMAWSDIGRSLRQHLQERP